MSQTFSINIDHLSCKIMTQDFLQSSQKKKKSTKSYLLQLEVKPRKSSGSSQVFSVCRSLKERDKRKPAAQNITLCEVRGAVQGCFTDYLHLSLLFTPGQKC